MRDNRVYEKGQLIERCYLSTVDLYSGLTLFQYTLTRNSVKNMGMCYYPSPCDPAFCCPYTSVGYGGFGGFGGYGYSPFMGPAVIGGPIIGGPIIGGYGGVVDVYDTGYVGGVGVVDGGYDTGYVSGGGDAYETGYV